MKLDIIIQQHYYSRSKPNSFGGGGALSSMKSEGNRGGFILNEEQRKHQTRKGRWDRSQNWKQSLEYTLRRASSLIRIDSQLEIKARRFIDHYTAGACSDHTL